MHLLRSLKESNTDIRLLWGLVFVRMAGYGLTNQVLTLYLEALGNSGFQIGIFMTLTLVGDTIISYMLTWNADRIGRRKVIIIGTGLMIFSGLIFAKCSNFHLLLFAAIVGVISPSGDETGPFKSVEEASIAHLTPNNHRPEIFAFYGLFTTAGAALGSVLAGLLVDHMNLTWKFELETCYRIIFVVYAIFSFFKFILACFLSPKCEIYHKNIGVDDEDTSLLPENEPVDTKKLSQTTLHILPRLLIVFMLDSLGYGFMPSAWIVYYLKKTFEITATSLGVLFFVTNSINAISSLPSAYFSKLLGPVKAILFTQVPSAIFFSIITVMNSFPVVVVLLILYYFTSTMDVVPRQILLTTVIPKHEITKVMGIVNIGKTFARCFGPVFTGRLATHKKLHFGFLINGICLILADSVLGISFLKLDHEILLKQSINQSIE